MSGNPYDDPEFKRWATHAKKELRKLEASALTAALISPASLDELDIAQAVEIGASLLLGKPLILLVLTGAKCPPGLAKAADAIVEVDGDNLGSESNQRRIKAAIDAVAGPDDD